MFIAVLFIIIKKGKQGKHVSADSDNQNILYPHNGILFKKKRNAALIQAALEPEDGHCGEFSDFLFASYSQIWR